ncbi:PREDICTED: POM121-like protein 2-like [Elephantulus edwardii]|uniref:POM121-like protein 2-like n=1 Tax=Elephantulus edwardii TaxID=28737 RepID=UPI0003F0D38C|nr:PREDICTED: POM121-like protein 2-like [Elephantulus edwardii]
MRKGLMPKAWRHSNKLDCLGLTFSSNWETQPKHRLTFVHHHRCLGSLVTVRIAPSLKHRPPLLANLAEEPLCTRRTLEKQRQDPCSKEAMLQALWQCHKGKRKFEEPLWFEVLDSKKPKVIPEAGRSAFRPLKNGKTPAFVPRPGSLKKQPGTWTCSLCEKWIGPGYNKESFLKRSQPSPFATKTPLPMADKKPEMDPFSKAAADLGVNLAYSPCHQSACREG